MSKVERENAWHEASHNATAEDLADNLRHIVEQLQRIEQADISDRTVREFAGHVLDDIQAHAHNRTHPIRY